MAMDALKDDMKSVAAKIRTLNPQTSTGELVKLLKGEVWPFIESVASELEEIDISVAEIVEGQDECLQPESAQLFAGIIAGGVGMAAKVRELATKNGGMDEALTKAVDDFEALCKEGAALVDELTVDPEDEGDPEDEPAQLQGASS
jgi:hypothetical protein